MDLLVRVLLAGVAFAVTGALVTRWPRLLLARGPVPVAVLAVAAAAGAAVAPGAPTALTAVDVALRAALAAAVTAASARARRQVWLFASTATVVAGVGASLDWLAFVATGATLAMLVLGRRSWIVGAFIGACLSQVLLRLDLGGTTGTERGRGRRRRRAAHRLRAAPRPALDPAAGLDHRRSSWPVRPWCSAAPAALAAAGAAGDVRDGIDAGRDGLAAARAG